jgi:alpha-glucosidase (family GH31 glycosyl hydrolase)
MLAFEAQFTAEEGNIGLPYVTHDIGSYNGVPVAGTCGALPVSKVAGHLPEDLYVRWVQFGTFQPLDRLHSDHGDRLPWQYSPSAAAAAGAFLRLREELVPYLYTMARRSYDTGLPMVRALYLQWPDLAGAYSHPSEYTLGPDMLVAPVISPGSSARTSVWIPPGTWIDYFTGAHFTGPTTVQLEVPLQQYPVFVRSGAVIPTQPEELSTTAVGPQDPLVLTAWPGAAGSFDVYDDQGQGFSYQDGADTWTHVTATQPTPSCTSLTIAAARGRFPGAPAARSWEVRFADVAAPGAVTLGGRPLPSGPPGSPGTFSYDRASRTVAVRTPELSTKSPVTITAGPCR